MEKREADDSLRDWNAVTLDEAADYLRGKFVFDSSGTARCVHHLIDFYERHKNQNNSETDNPTFVMFRKGAVVTEEILQTDMNIREFLTHQADELPEANRRRFLQHTNSLLLNVLLNRLDEFNDVERGEVERRVREARRTICDLLH